jgi:hypothetical protein
MSALSTNRSNGLTNMTHEQETSVLIDMEAALAAPPLKSMPPRKSNPMPKLAGLALLAALFGTYWYSDVIFNYSSADEQCIKFAEETETNPSSNPDPSDKNIFVANKWIRGTNVVVELGQKMASKHGYYQSRLCVVGGGQIQIPSVFEQWQYR